MKANQDPQDNLETRHLYGSHEYLHDTKLQGELQKRI
jgi:hypothetical protein